MMFVVRSVTFALVLTVITAASNLLPEPIVINHGEGYDNLHLYDKGFKDSDVKDAVRFNPDIQNVLHLFTRLNPTQSQPMLLNADLQLAESNFNTSRRTAVIVHDWTESATSNVNTVLVPAILKAADYNVFVYDWSAGASILEANGPKNAILSGLSLSRAIDWICSSTGASSDQFHLMGFNLGAHVAGVAGKNVQKESITYITALDPAANMKDGRQIFSPDAATYNEVIRNEIVMMSPGEPLAHVDFHPNGRDLHPGCGISFSCNHDSHDKIKKLLTQNQVNQQGCNFMTTNLSSLLEVLNSVIDSSVVGSSVSQSSVISSTLINSSVSRSEIISSTVIDSSLSINTIVNSRLVSCSISRSTIKGCSLNSQSMSAQYMSC